MWLRLLVVQSGSGGLVLLHLYLALALLLLMLDDVGLLLRWHLLLLQPYSAPAVAGGMAARLLGLDGAAWRGQAGMVISPGLHEAPVAPSA